MEKKNIRPAQASKGLVVSKKNQDSVTKTGQRYGHRREGNGSNKVNRDFTNRPTPPRAKINLPRSRGGNAYQRNNLNPDVPEDIPESTDDFELYSVFEPGSKKQNLNHLLNFHRYEPRERFNAPESFGRSARMPANRARYDKRQFLQANCQFLVRPHIKYSPNIAFVDTLVDWEPIEQIYLTTFEDLQCPICLFPPVACKITKCGHIYCWPCILHYLALSDKPWRRCPICHEAVTVADLKSAIGKPVHFSNPSDVVTFTLMKRDRENLIVLKSDQPASSQIPSSASLDIYSKIFFAEVETINEIIDREKRELLLELKNQGSDCPESVFVEQALQLLEERRVELLKELPSPAGIQEQAEEKDGATANTWFYFYQASDGQHMYLHPINCKMLETTYGHVKNAPPTITGKILQKESKSMNETTRKRYKHLAHLPLTCEIDLVEIEFLDPVIPEEIIQIFQLDLKQRESKRIHKERAENVRSKHIDELNKKQLGYRYETEEIPINLDSIEQFPMCVETPEAKEIAACEAAGPKWSKVIKAPEQAFWPTLPTSGGLQEFVTKKPEPIKKPSPPNSYEEDIDDFAGLREFDRLQLQQTLGGAIAQAIQKAGTTPKQPQQPSNGKKKGKKGVTLFATGVAFGGK